jgi:hypothetical protein
MNAYTGAPRRATPARAPRAPRATVLLVAIVAVAVALAACSSEGRFSVCGVAALEVPTGPRGHGAPTRDSLWPAKLAEEIAAVPADSVVRVLLVHASAVTAADREFVVARGGTIVEEQPSWDGFVATFTVEALRAFAPQASTTRIIDAHLVRTRVLPPCG